MFTYCFNNDFICIFISLLCILYFMMTNAATRISRFGTIKCYCIVLYCIVLYCIVLYCIVLYCIVLYMYSLLLRVNLTGGHVHVVSSIECPAS